MESNEKELAEAPGSAESLPAASDLAAELAAAREALTEAQAGQVATASELETLRAAHAEMAAAHTEQAGHVEALTAQLGETRAQSLAAHQRALLAEHAGQIVPELVVGTTVDELDASVEAAQEAYARAVEAARHQLMSVAVPVGAAPRTEPPVEQMSPLEKISRALRR